jgi:hypothetical protein
MNMIKMTAGLGLMLAVSACTDVQNKTIDQNIFDGGNNDLSNLTAGIWVDPVGCEHWIIDDGVEGYADARRDKYGVPVCSNVAPPETAVGPFKRGTFISDPL